MPGRQRWNSGRLARSLYMSWTPSRYARRPGMGDAIRPVMDVTAAQTIGPRNEETSGSASGTSCLAGATSEAPVVTLVTACVRYLRCSVCGFIWTVGAPEAQAPTE